jgi:hypothetical protein
VAIVDVIRATNPKEFEWATYKLKYASCKHRPIMMFLELQTKKGFNSSPYIYIISDVPRVAHCRKVP